MVPVIGALTTFVSNSVSGFVSGIFGGGRQNNPAVRAACDSLYPEMVDAFNSGSVDKCRTYNMKVKNLDSQFDNIKDEDRTLQGTGIDRIGDMFIWDDRNKWVGLDTSANPDPKVWHSEGTSYIPSQAVSVTLLPAEKRGKTLASAGISNLKSAIASFPTWVLWLIGGVLIVFGFLWLRKKKKGGRK